MENEILNEGTFMQGGDDVTKKVNFEVAMYHRLDLAQYQTRRNTEIILFDGDAYTKKSYGDVVDLSSFQGRVYKAFSNATFFFSAKTKSSLGILNKPSRIPE